MSYLDDLLAATEARVAATKAVVGEGALEQRVAGIGAPRGFTRAIASGDVSIIAEIKRATPRAGVLDLELEAGATAARYEAGGAAAISVLTEPDYFKGSMEDLRAARSASSLPVLRKDFVLDDYQVLESRAEGADAVLLIVKVVGDRLDGLHASAVALGMDALVEVNGEDELDRALDAGATLVGVNHRDLETFEVDPELTAKLAPRLPDGVTLVALSGVSSRAEVVALSSAGADAILIGKSIVTAADPAAKIRELLGRP